MDKRIKEWIDAAQQKFGLDHYYLHSHQLYREVTLLNETDYFLSMEWFPSHITEWEEDNNPEGTAVVTVNLHTGQYKSVIFVGGKSFAAGTPFQRAGRNEIIRWIAAEAGIVYGRQFRLDKEQDGEYHFIECVDGVPLSPGGRAELRFDAEGKLTFYSVYGTFPDRSLLQEADYTLTLEAAEPLAKKQLKLVELPLLEEQRIIPVYGLEEIFIANDGLTAIPLELIRGAGKSVNIDKLMTWEQPAAEAGLLERMELSLHETVTLEQAEAREPHPDSFPIAEAEQAKCIGAAEAALRQIYPQDSGQWVLKSLQRDRGYIQAVLRPSTSSNRVFQRKLLLFIDPRQYTVINYMDNAPLLSMFDDFQREEKVAVSHEEAYDKLKGRLELTPVYVYDAERKKYLLCGKLDCRYGVIGASGDVVELNSLQ
ncbi:hypothetical protein ABD76_17080 [Paenibacillus dendritiformis]|uniref:hypothetical protein n=1 Tax=Paenibacillus dendritiformis TaxID=130049 RepID=UPI0018CE49DC|nr:hypothetical protein [Paenibacillus dendritiformis]MBG9794124.1 hypothetical protein [Paenibacillus dendritiformis]